MEQSTRPQISRTVTRVFSAHSVFHCLKVGSGSRWRMSGQPPFGIALKTPFRCDVMSTYSFLVSPGWRVCSTLNPVRVTYRYPIELMHAQQCLKISASGRMHAAHCKRNVKPEWQPHACTAPMHSSQANAIKLPKLRL